MLHALIQPPWSQDRKSREQAFRTMHTNAIKTDPYLICKMRKSIKEYHTERNYDVSVTSWSLTNCSIQYTPQSPLINVVLQELFPVLEGAVVCHYAVMTSFVPQGSNITHLHVPFVTLLHGQVMLSCAGIDIGCCMDIIKTNVEGHEAECHCLRGYPELLKGIAHCGMCISLVHYRSCCRACGKKDDNSSAKHLRCSRCWETLRAPVWYCNALCQAADHARHKHECGKVPR